MAVVTGKKALRNFLVTGIVSRSRRVLANLDRVQKSPTSRATHGLSTAIRRLLVARVAVRELYGRTLLPKRERRKVQVFRDVLGSVRDVQEMRKKLASLEADSPFAQSLATELAHREESAAREVVSAIQEFSAGPLQRLTRKKVVRKLCKGPMRVPLPELLSSLASQVEVCIPEAINNGNDQALHGMRVKYKRLRYTVELLAPEVIHFSRNRLKYLRTLQQAMGEAHDWLVLLETVNAFSIGHGRKGAEEMRGTVHSICKQAHENARLYVRTEWPQVVKLIDV